jgi:uncharacterized membrane protein
LRKGQGWCPGHSRQRVVFEEAVIGVVIQRQERDDDEKSTDESEAAGGMILGPDLPIVRCVPVVFGQVAVPLAAVAVSFDTGVNYRRSRKNQFRCEQSGHR